MLTYSISDARSIIGELINRVKFGNEKIAIGRCQKPEVLIIPYKYELNEHLPITKMNFESQSFDFLKNEPDLYSISDLKKKYV